MIRWWENCKWLGEEWRVFVAISLPQTLENWNHSTDLHLPSPAKQPPFCNGPNFIFIASGSIQIISLFLRHCKFYYLRSTSISYLWHTYIVTTKVQYLVCFILVPCFRLRYLYLQYQLCYNQGFFNLLCNYVRSLFAKRKTSLGCPTYLASGF